MTDLAAPPDLGRRVRPGAIVLVLSTCGVVAALMQTLVVPLLPNLPVLLHTSAANASWVLTATLLAGAVSTPISGRLGDMYGKRRILLCSLGLLVLGSTVSALTSDVGTMVLGRILQGSAMGAIPLGISIMRDTLPAERLGSAMALMSATIGVGGGVGLPLSALVAQQADWHLLFWLAAVLGLLSAAAIAWMVPESPLRAGGRFDFAGALGMVLGLSCLLLAITQGGSWGWGSPAVLGLLGAALVILLGWGWYEYRVRQPLVDLRVSARRQVLMTNLASVLVGFAMYAQALILPQLLQAPVATGYGFGQSLVVAGICMAPSGLIMIVISPVSARISAAYGPRTSLAAGIAVIMLGYGSAVFLMHSAWQIVLVASVISVGVALAYAAMPALIMRAVPASETAAANGLNALMRALGTSFSSAVLSVVLTQLTFTLGPLTLPSKAGFQVSFLIAAGVSAAGLVLTMMIPRMPAAPHPATPGTRPGG
ncbi:MFS transporter [Amycolatopsis nigrescens]|uniref:MFS transporter n=1 Tax=Amycolatopsis nigrescens TaxID=381445 RepID=UPI00036BE3E7|nr:MFS transporter [Amycolatopsis nigrescens]